MRGYFLVKTHGKSGLDAELELYKTCRTYTFLGVFRKFYHYWYVECEMSHA